MEGGADRLYTNRRHKIGSCWKWAGVGLGGWEAANCNWRRKWAAAATSFGAPSNPLTFTNIGKKIIR